MIETKTRREWHARMPKVELHLHLEGSIPLATMWDLIQKYGGDSSVSGLEDLRHRFQFRDFSHFIQTWIWKNQFLREFEDFTYISEQIAIHLRTQNIKYVEAFFSPARFAEKGLAVPQLMEAIRTGLDRVPEIEIALIPDLVRDVGPNMAMDVLREILQLNRLGIIGIGLGGSEQLFPPELFEDHYLLARKAGLHTTAHAGEAAGASSIWGAIQSLRVDRIGHGTRSHEDESLIKYLVETQIPLEMCPLSNVSTGTIGAHKLHPIRDYFDKGLLVTVNTDDPMMFGNSMAQEFDALEQNFNFKTHEIQKLILNSIDASWLEIDRKVALQESFVKDPLWSYE
ncbi:adenosine deaminase [Dehalococcoidia bacterium]|nr:adenosine deaminase [Dehalococcoidia bacterium]